MMSGGVTAKAIARATSCLMRQAGEALQRARGPPHQARLCIVAHPDDIEFYCAGAILRDGRHGAVVDFVLATSGDKGRAIPASPAPRSPAFASVSRRWPPTCLASSASNFYAIRCRAGREPRAAREVRARDPRIEARCGADVRPQRPRTAFIRITGLWAASSSTPHGRAHAILSPSRRQVLLTKRQKPVLRRHTTDAGNRCCDVLTHESSPGLRTRPDAESCGSDASLENRTPREENSTR